MMTVSLVTICVLTLAIAALALGYGTLYPQFETENAAQIPTSFGGLVFMMTTVALLAAVIVRPLAGGLYLRARGVRPPAGGDRCLDGDVVRPRGDPVSRGDGDSVADCAAEDGGVRILNRPSDPSPSQRRGARGKTAYSLKLTPPPNSIRSALPRTMCI